jgi:hypothetical protein
MARPNKTGLDYFPLDVDFFENEKMLAISGEFSVKGEIISLRLLCEIYRNGYFVEYSELLKNKLARLGGLSGGLVDEVVGKLVKYGFFEESLFCDKNILTSNGIQKRFISASKRRENGLCCNNCLIKEVSVCKNYLPDEVSVCKNAQRKGKESKVNKIPPTDPPTGGSSLPGTPDSGHVHPAVDAERSNMPPEGAPERSGSEAAEPAPPESPDGESPGRSGKAFSSFISGFNLIRSAHFRPVEKVRRQFNARLKEGFTPEDMLGALQNAMKEAYHIGTAFKYLTPEFFTRPDKLERYGQKTAAAVAAETGVGVWIEGGRKFYGDRRSPVEVPLNAPKRLFGNSFYNQAKNAWEVC